MKLPKIYFREDRNTWMIRIRGRRISLGPIEKVARKKADEMIKKAIKGEPLPVANTQKDLPLSRVIDCYLIDLEKRVAASTCAVVRHRLRSFEKVIGGNADCGSVTPLQVQEFMHTFKASSTKAKVLAEISALYTWANKMFLTDGNPAKNVKRPQPSKREKFLPRHEFFPLLECCYAVSKEFGDICEFMLETGARVQEAINLRFGHWDGSKLVIPADDAANKKKTATRLIFCPGKINGSLRTKYDAAYATYPDDYQFMRFFSTPGGRKWTPSSLKIAFKTVEEHMRLPGLCGTMLRHSFAVAKLEEGLSPELVAKLLGHSSTMQVYKTYGHLDKLNLLARLMDESDLTSGK